jgi:hypothetical protein
MDVNHDYSAIHSHSGTFGLGLVPYDFLSVVLHTISIISYNLSCMLRCSV